MNAKRILLQLLLASAAVSLAAQAHATGVAVLENGDGDPSVITDDVTVAAMTTAAEFVDLTGSIGLLIPVAGVRAVVLTEPATDPFGPSDSDIVVLDVSDPAAPTAQQFRLQFASDGAAQFDALLAQYGPNAIRVPESGGIDGLEVLMNSVPLFVHVQSDLQGPEVPEPATLALLSIGLAGVGLMRSGRRSA